MNQAGRGVDRDYGMLGNLDAHRIVGLASLSRSLFKLENI
jgi:hypothetical protein